MTKTFKEIRKVIDECPAEQLDALRKYIQQKQPHSLENDWGIDADTILSAISRSSDLTKRGVRGIIAEAVFVNEIAPTVADDGWKLADIKGDYPYDALLEKEDKQARIQVKLQRLEKGKPKLYYPKHYEEGSLYVAEVQKTRTGKKAIKSDEGKNDKAGKHVKNEKQNTRPYSFSDFDILAVNMHPSTQDWQNFRYTVASWLLPRTSDENLIEIFQPVAAQPNDVWTADLAECLSWLSNSEKRKVLADLKHTN